MLTYKGEVFCELYKRLAACRIDRAEMVWTREKNVRWQNRTSVVTMETKYHPSAWAYTETLVGQHQSGGGETRNDIAGGGEFRDVPGQEELERLLRWQALDLSAQRYRCRYSYTTERFRDQTGHYKALYKWFVYFTLLTTCLLCSTIFSCHLNWSTIISHVLILSLIFFCQVHRYVGSLSVVADRSNKEVFISAAWTALTSGGSCLSSPMKQRVSAPSDSGTRHDVSHAWAASSMSSRLNL